MVVAHVFCRTCTHVNASNFNGLALADGLLWRLFEFCFGIRSERRLCDEVHLNLAYRWFCRLGLDGEVPDHSTFSKNRHGRFRESDLSRKLFETVVARCIKERIVGGEAFAVDASIIVADAHRRRSVAKVEDLDPTSSRAVAEYLSVLDDAAFGGATLVEPKAISPTDPAARYTASANSVAGYAYSDNYLIDLKHAVIMDVEATTTIRQAEVGAAKAMLDRTAEQFDVTPSRLVADGGYGSAEMVGWLVDERVLELKAPETPEPAALLRLWPFVRDLSRQLRTCGDLLDQPPQFARQRRGCNRSPHLGQQRPSVLPVADPVRDRQRCCHAARPIPDDGLRGAAVHLRAGLPPSPFDGIGRATGGSRAF
jgi:Transposase domain (DUF772)